MSDDSKIHWVETRQYMHPSQDFKEVDQGSEVELITYISQFVPVTRIITKTDKKTGEEKVINKTEETCVIITSDARSIPLFEEDQKVDGFIPKVLPSTYGGQRWSRKSIKTHLAKSHPSPNFLEVYQKIEKELRYYFEFEEEGTYDVIICWAIGTYFHELFNFYPLLYLNAAKGSGKTKLLHFLHQICFNSIFCQDPSDSTIFRLAHANKCTILIDEIEGVSKKDKSGLRSLLLGSPNKGIIIPRSEQKNVKVKSFDVKLFNLYGPRAIANITGIDDVLEDRCITVILKRALNKQVLNREVRSENPVWQDIRDLLYRLVLSDKGGFGGPHALKMVLDNFKLPEQFSVVSADNVVSAENKMVEGYLPVSKDFQEILHTLTTQTTKKNLQDYSTFSTLTTLNLQTTQELVAKSSTLIVGRNLNVWKPILALAGLTHPHILFRTIQHASTMLDIKKAETDIDNLHITVLQHLIKKVDSDMWYKSKNLLSSLKEYEGLDWITSQWFGRVLKSLGLNQKRRVAGGREYYLTVKALKKMSDRFVLDYDKLKDEALEERAEKENGSPAETIPSEVLENVTKNKEIAK